MIISRYAYITVGTRNVLYWRSLGYDVKRSDRFKAKTSEIPPLAIIVVACKCERCGIKYIRQFKGCKELCHSCWASRNMKRQGFVGEKHPRWRADKQEFVTYGNRVRWLSEKTYRANISKLNPNNYPRTLCGVDGGYQLDHIVSIKKSFELGNNPEEVSHVDNLRLIPWKENRNKWF